MNNPNKGKCLCGFWPCAHDPDTGTPTPYPVEAGKEYIAHFDENGDATHITTGTQELREAIKAVMVGEPNAGYWADQIMPLFNTRIAAVLEKVEKEVIGVRDDDKRYKDMSAYAKRKVMIEYELRVKQNRRLQSLRKEVS